MSLLHAVKGRAEACAPCVLSAVTGRSSEDWPDIGVSDGCMEKALIEAGFRPVPLSETSLPLWKPLSEFCHPLRSRMPLAELTGLWVLLLRWREAGPDHVAAVEVCGRTKCKRRFVDNNYRRPTALSRVVRSKHFSSAFVGHGWRLTA